MKRILFTAILCGLAVTATGCGDDREKDRDGTSHYDDFSYTVTGTTPTREHDRDDNIIDDMEDAGKDIVSGAKDAADDLID